MDSLSLQMDSASDLHLKTAFLRSPIRVLACARGLLSLSSVLSVVDDVSSRQEGEFGEIWDLAEEARRPLYPGHWPRDPQVKQAFVQAAVLAATALLADLAACRHAGDQGQERRHALAVLDRLPAQRPFGDRGPPAFPHAGRGRQLPRHADERAAPFARR